MLLELKFSSRYWYPIRKNQYDKDTSVMEYSDTNETSLWRITIVPVEIELYLLKQNQLYFRRSKHENNSFNTEMIK